MAISERQTDGKPSSAAKGAGKMWRDLLVSEAQERLTFTAVLSEIGDSGRIQMPVAITGRWVHPANQRKIIVTANDLRAAIQNFRKKPNGEINVDNDHASEIPNFAGGARPSAGRVLALQGPEPYTDSQGMRREILWGNYKPTEMARGLIRRREYRYISPVLARERVDKATGETQGMTITTIALTNTPVLEEMPEIFCSEEGQVLRLTGTEFSPRGGGRGPSATQNSNEALARLAVERARQDSISYDAALRLVSHEHRDLAAQARAIAYSETEDPPVHVAGDELARKAVAKSKAEKIDYQTALSEVSRENSELSARWVRQVGREDSD
jgi:phage I-like protein